MENRAAFCWTRNRKNEKKKTILQRMHEQGKENMLDDVMEGKKEKILQKIEENIYRLDDV